MCQCRLRLCRCPCRQPEAGLHADQFLSDHRDQPAETGHHGKPRKKKDDRRAKALREEAGSLGLKEQNVSADRAGLDKAEKAQTKGQQKRIIAGSHHFVRAV